ncbi:MAG: hypothetical protein JOS17DRAFT_785167 [Linnemannia elongata]|nr:MAG: hypothetical protein JOS17DRAFT_785167 [Linnemannia elongata]
MLVASYLPLFETRYDDGLRCLVTTWDPKHLLRAAAVCKVWRQVFAPVLWKTYDLAIMEKKVPLDVLPKKIHLAMKLTKDTVTWLI